MIRLVSLPPGLLHGAGWAVNIGVGIGGVGDDYRIERLVHFPAGVGGLALFSDGAEGAVKGKTRSERFGGNSAPPYVPNRSFANVSEGANVKSSRRGVLPLSGIVFIEISPFSIFSIDIIQKIEESGETPFLLWIEDCKLHFQSTQLSSVTFLR